MEVGWVVDGVLEGGWTLGGNRRLLSNGWTDSFGPTGEMKRIYF